MITPRFVPENAHRREMLEELQGKSINQRFQLTLYGKPGFDKFFAHGATHIYFTTYDSDSEVPAFN